MKVDLVVNSMIQQIDRNLQTQVMPALSFRAGEILRGRVMLTSDDTMQIRLDSGALLNALPAGDVLLMQGATVTLRVTGRMDGKLVMQLLEQETEGEQAPAQAGAKELARTDLNATPRGREVLQSMERMGLPLREETARQALELLQAFPGLKADRAVFMAANRMPATQEYVDALNRLLDDGATTGGELMKLAGLLAAQAPEGERSQEAALPAEDSMLRLQSLTLMALGIDAAEQHTGTIAALADHGALAKAAEIALEGPFMSLDQLESGLASIAATLPEDLARDARAFLKTLVEGIVQYIRNNGTDGIAPQATMPEKGLARAIREIMELFVQMDRGETAESGEALAKAAGSQKASLSRLALEIENAGGAANPETSRQLNTVSGHVRLLNDISQYICQQIPVRLAGKNRTVELYVLNRGKRGKRINAENANMLIALDTENMGRVEALVNISRKNLRLSIGVEHPWLVGHVNAYTADLGNALKEIGYRLSDLRAQVIGRAVDPLTVMQAVEPSKRLPGALDVKI
jgi:hypothetical protein